MRIVQNLAEFDIDRIRAAVVFVFAGWSGPSYLALRRVTGLLSTLELGSLDVIILDNDSMTAEDMIRLFGRAFYGAGETLWIRDGRLIAELSVNRPESEELILSHTKRLLEAQA